MIPIGFMFIQCKEGSEDMLLEKIRRISGVVYVYKVDKSYDLVVKVESDSDEQFTSAIAMIRSAGDILNTDTMIGFKRQ